MKNISVLSLVAAAAAVLATSARADDLSLKDPYLQMRNHPATATREVKHEHSTTVGVYANDRGVARKADREEDRGEFWTEQRTDAHGHTYSIYRSDR